MGPKSPNLNSAQQKGKKYLASFAQVESNELLVMKIAHVLHPYQENLGYQENHLPAKQRELGHDVRIFTSNHIPKRFDTTQQHQPGEYVYNGVPTYRLPAYVTFDSIGQALIHDLFEQLSEFAPDVVHSHGLLTLQTVQSLHYDLRSDSRLFVDIHVDNDNLHLDSYSKLAAYMLYTNSMLPVLKRRVDTFLPVNPYAERFVTTNIGIDPSSVELLPLGVNINKFNRRDADDIRWEFGIDDSTMIYLYVGRIDETKDLAILIEAFHQLCQQFNDVFLLIVGTGPQDHLKKLKGMVDVRGIDDDVAFTGYVDYEVLPDYYSSADVGVWPGKLGVSIIEALGCGLPLVVCDSLATGFLIDNKNGVTFPRGNVESLRERIQFIRENDDARERMGSNSSEYARNHLSWNKIAKESIRIYRPD